MTVFRSFGESWHAALRLMLLLMHSVVARVERHILIHPDHAESAGITHSHHGPVWRNARPFA